MIKSAIIVLCFVCAAFATDFVHPGGLDSKRELDFVKARIRAGDEPWKSEFERLKSSTFATREPNGRATINSSDHDAAALIQADATAAYGQALLWKYSGEELYAKRAAAILNSWSGFEKFNAGTDQDKLQAGWTGSVMASAAEILREYRGWKSRDVKALRTMFRRAFYPQLNAPSKWNGNVDLTQTQAMIAIAVFNDDRDEFNFALARFRIRIRAYFYLKSDGALPPAIEGDNGDIQAFWFKPSKWVDGLTQESCRDNGHHTQYAIGTALQTAEIAWHQGVDLYEEVRPRLTASMELLAGQLLAGSMGGVCANDAPSKDRYDSWEIGFNHYHERRGIALPNTARLIETQIRPNAPRADQNLVFSMLTHGLVLKN